jgi:general secretion pathway protein D
VIIDPSVRGTITVRSYDMLNEEQYYQFFLSVLDVYGFAVINMNNGVLKVVRAKDAKTSAVPVASEAAPGEGDEVVTRVVPLTNVAARDLAPLLRQLNDNAGAGSVVHYEPSNVLLMTGRAAVIKRLLTIVERVDNAGDRSVVTVPSPGPPPRRWSNWLPSSIKTPASRRCRARWWRTWWPMSAPTRYW